MRHIEFDDWCLIDESAPGAGAIEHARLARWSAQLEGGVKFALPPASTRPRLRAEWPRAVGDDMVERREAIDRGLRQACGLVAGVRDETEMGSAPSGGTCPADLCRAAGWPADIRDDGSAVVDLGVPGDYVAARVERTQSGLRARAGLAAAPKRGSAPERAIGLLLLRANGAFRMVRGAICEDGVVLEVCSDAVGAAGSAENGRHVEAPVEEEASTRDQSPRAAAAEAALLGEALSALCVAAGSIAREARLLRERPDLAEAFTGRVVRRRTAPAADPPLAVGSTATR